MKDQEANEMALRLWQGMNDQARGRFALMQESTGIAPDDWTGHGQLVVAELAKRPGHFTDRVADLFELVRQAAFETGWHAHAVSVTTDPDPMPAIA